MNTATGPSEVVYRQGWLATVGRALAAVTYGTLMRSIFVLIGVFILDGTFRGGQAPLLYRADVAPYLAGGVVVIDVLANLTLAVIGFVRERVTISFMRETVTFEGVPWRALRETEWLTGPVSWRRLEVPFGAVRGVEMESRYGGTWRYRAGIRVIGPTFFVAVPWRFRRMSDLDAQLRALAGRTPPPPESATWDWRERRIRIVVTALWVLAMVVVSGVVVPMIVGW